MIVHRLVVLQNKAVRIIVKAEYLAHVNPIYKKLHLLKLNDICQQKIMVFVYKSTNNLLPINFSNYFCAAKDIHTHTLQDTPLISTFRLQKQM